MGVMKTMTQTGVLVLKKQLSRATGIHNVVGTSSVNQIQILSSYRARCGECPAIWFPRPCENREPRPRVLPVVRSIQFICAK